MEVLRTFEQSCKSAADASQKQLLSILKDNADTEYGKKYHFAYISSVSEYKKQVPLSTFEDYEDFVSKMMQGKENLLTAYPVSFYAHTSGTLGAEKHIPYTEKAEEIVHRYASLPLELPDTESIRRLNPDHLSQSMTRPSFHPKRKRAGRWSHDEAESAYRIRGVHSGFLQIPLPDLGDSGTG